MLSFLFFSNSFIKIRLLFKERKPQRLSLQFWLHFSSSLAVIRGWAPLISPAFAEGSSGAAWQEKVQPYSQQMVPSSGVRKEKYFPESIWHSGSLVWNQLGRGQGPWLGVSLQCRLQPIGNIPAPIQRWSVPRKLFVMISLLALVCKLLYNLNVSIQNLKCTGFVQPEVEMKFSLGSWQALLSHLSN